MTEVKVFQIGFNKCATRTIAHFFDANGYKALHYRQGKLARNIRDSMAAGVKPLQKFADTVFFSDLEYVSPDDLIEAYKYFAYLDDCFPDAFFILNTRRVEDWLISRALHEGGDYLRAYMGAYGETNPIPVLQRWQSDWETHIPAVRAHFANRPGKLLEYDINADGPEKIVDHFDGVFHLDLAKWTYRGKTRRG